MDSQQIYSILCWDKDTRESFLGVFPADLVPLQKLPNNSSLVFNTDPKGKPGQHWVAVFVDGKGNGEYFDSYGQPPSSEILPLEFVQQLRSRRFKFNKVQVQGDLSKSCGFYCVLYIKKRCQGKSMEDILSTFRATYAGAMDSSVEAYVKTLYSKTPMSLALNSYSQSCCSKN